MYNDPWPTHTVALCGSTGEGHDAVEGRRRLSCPATPQRVASRSAQMPTKRRARERAPLLRSAAHLFLRLWGWGWPAAEARPCAAPIDTWGEVHQTSRTTPFTQVM
ncbi:uncharacterized protein Tco025E_07948 [Trypanosoma conorhini]|uniref:Uncharacterized protein n=1 Tax=Trypanosoma conorhini TaxID=83891 RepID=A0A3R7KMC4_9TRYP|nr:uncharacterized protein Tco025E_07948 [Trypanosoma conorhini]RNF04490.1 hypothetical protein Tco025E_07948 [Trypanosoma conorhini]